MDRQEYEVRKAYERKMVFRESCKPIYEMVTKVMARCVPKIIIYQDGRTEYEWPPEYEAALKVGKEMIDCVGRQVYGDDYKPDAALDKE